MKLRLGRKLQTREWVLILLACVVMVGVPVVKRLVLPAYDRFQELRAEVRRLSGEFVQLTSNLSVRQQVEAEFARLGPKSIQRDSDEITLSTFLRDVEAMARKPNVMIVNMKPMPVEEAASYKTYRVRLAVSGRLADLTQFLDELLNGPSVTAIENFSIRGVQDGRGVECTFQLALIELLPPELQRKPQTKKSVIGPAGGKGKRDGR